MLMTSPLPVVHAMRVESMANGTLQRGNKGHYENRGCRQIARDVGEEDVG
jgi:hypothetical protein